MEQGEHVAVETEASVQAVLRLIDEGGELPLGRVDPELSHISNDLCRLCRAAKGMTESNDAPEANYSSLARSA